MSMLGFGPFTNSSSSSCSGSCSCSCHRRCSTVVVVAVVA